MLSITFLQNLTYFNPLNFMKSYFKHCIGLNYEKLLAIWYYLANNLYRLSNLNRQTEYYDQVLFIDLTYL